MTTVRPYRASDAAALAALYVRSVTEIGSRLYSPEQVAVWAAHGPSPERIHALYTDGRTALVAVDESDGPVAFSDVEGDGHIQFLYCAPEAAGRGIAAALYDTLEKEARARGLTRLYAEASEAARPFFLKKGFAVTTIRRFEVSGVPIHNYAMEKLLVGRPQ